MDAQNENEGLLRLRSNVSKLFTLSKYYSAYVQDRSSPGLFTTLMQSIQYQLGPEDHELSRLINRYEGTVPLSKAEFESLRAPLVSACQMLIRRKLSTSDAQLQ